MLKLMLTTLYDRYEVKVIGIDCDLSRSLTLTDRICDQVTSCISYFADQNFDLKLHEQKIGSVLNEILKSEFQITYGRIQIWDDYLNCVVNIGVAVKIDQTFIDQFDTLDKSPFVLEMIDHLKNVLKKESEIE